MMKTGIHQIQTGMHNTLIIYQSLNCLFKTLLTSVQNKPKALKYPAQGICQQRL